MSKLRNVLFTIIPLLTTAACGGDRAATSTVERGKPSVALEVVAPAEPDKIAPPTAKPAKIDPLTVEETHPIPTKYSEVMEEGKALAAKGDHTRAREMFEAAIKLDKAKASPHVELARLFITTGDRGMAITAATKAVKLAPESSQAWNTLGRAELARFDYDKATLAFRQATELDPGNVWAWNNLGLVHLSLKQYPAAVDALLTATTLKTAESYMFNNLGTAYEQLDQLDEARAAFEQGGKLGSVAAAASRKRLDGVKTVVVMKAPKPATPTVETYQRTEEGDDDTQPTTDATVDDVIVEPNAAAADDVKPLPETL